MLAAALGAFASRLDMPSMPPAVIEAVKVRVLDTLGAGLAGVQLHNHHRLLPLLEAQGPCRIWGEELTGSARETALVNSFATHSTYLEDGSRFTGGHPSSVVIPAVLAEAEIRHSDGRAVIAAVAAGYEVFLRLGRAIYPECVNRGFQSTALLGSVSASAALANLRGFSPAATGHAIAIGANLGIGFKEALKSSGSQPIQVARSCEAGFVAAALAGAGDAGAPLVLENGFLKAFGGIKGSDPFIAIKGSDPFIGEILEGLGTEFRIDETYLKRHAGCRGNHAPLDATIDLIVKEGVVPEQVKQVRVFVDTVTRAAAIEEPADGEQAQFSIGFSVALAFIERNASIFHYTTARLSDPHVKWMMERITVGVDPSLDVRYPDERGARVEIELTDGRVLNHSVSNARGEPEWPLSGVEVEEKFLALATPRLGDAARTVRDLTQNLDDMKDIRELTQLLVPAKGRHAARA
ncbi:hypothetical protein DSM104443_03980 [Usitatibacter rugosus]|uniref:2-methylcitrate dehydratase PrpD n=1 Tax=Usitatibacter rugosus TaxID=2732067 RepID=A0A6M4H092_9PROT|nr:MmgE/PrpD family protein [Usitatibacter rugosus]QJR12886.1 hypothetical protein DSM104443_03980 [Usitatibacter rugosus]